jgi:hypothetical protein
MFAAGPLTGTGGGKKVGGHEKSVFVLFTGGNGFGTFGTGTINGFC